MGETLTWPTSALPSEGDVQDISNPETPTPGTSLTPHSNNAGAPTDPPRSTVAERFADEFWTSAIITTPQRLPSPPYLSLPVAENAENAENAESPTDPLKLRS